MASITIAIPTYNRPEKLRRLVEQIVPQLTDEFQIIIIDNCSDIPVSDYIVYSEIPLQIHRNKINVGGNTNVMRCFEYTTTEWIWVLGDDDNLQDGDLNTVLTASQEHKTALAINFSSCSKFSPVRNSTHSAKGLHDLLEMIENFSHLLWIPSNLFHISLLRDHIKLGNLFSYSHATQLVPLLLAASKGGEVVLSSRTVMIHGEPDPNDSWNYLTAMTGMGILLDLPMTVMQRRLLARSIQDMISLSYELVQLSYVSKHNLSEQRYLFVARWTRLICANPRSLKVAGISIIYILSFMQPVARLLVRTLYGLRRKPIPRSSEGKWFSRV